MDNHPIPQDITGFQFKLIGKMTIRQFIYLAIGAVIAWLVFFIIDPPALIKWPISLASIGIGAALAFIPIDGRPMDTMLRNFIKALSSPTKFLYKKGEIKKTPTSYAGAALPLVKAAPNTSDSNIQEKTAMQSTQVAPLQQPEAISTQPISISPATPAQPIPTPTEEPISEIKESTDLPEEDKATNKDLEQDQDTATVPPPAPVEEPVTNDKKDLEKMLQESQRQKESLEKQILEMQSKQESSQKEKVTPITAEPKKTTTRVKKIPNQMASSAGIPDAPEAPNLVTGIVKDPRGNPIQNIIIEVKDEDSNPARAFKTNSFGKFASATSLSNGKYTIAFEDPGEKHRFDEVALELTGSNVMPLEVTSIDSREELRRELFN